LKSKINAMLMSLYLFQFGILQPFSSILNSQLPIVVFTAGIGIIFLINNDFRFKKYVFILAPLLFIYFISHAFFYNIGLLLILTLFTEFFVKGYSGFIFASVPVNSQDFYQSLKKVAVINLFIVGFSPFIQSYDSMNYMRYGYAMVPSLLVFLI
jgi:hypothetical protein